MKATMTTIKKIMKAIREKLHNAGTLLYRRNRVLSLISVK